MSAVHTLELRPFLLEPVSVVGNDEDEVTCTSRFGHTWQERTFPLRAIQIFADDWVNEIRNISQRDTIDEVRVGGPHYLFQLLTDEYIHQLDVRKVSSGGISALRIHTNKRKSQWYGGDRGSIASLEAPSGYFINGIVGTINARSCIELSGYCCPFSSILKPDPENPVVQNSPKCGAGLFDGAQLAFTELCSDIRAIIIRCDQHVERLWVLSAHEYALFLVASDSGPLGKNEHCIEFYEHERIKAVHIQSHEVVNAIRLDTTHRSTPWFGKCTHGAISIFPSRFMDTRSVWGPSPHVLGFYGTIGSRYVGSLGVIFGVDQSACQVKDKGLKTICDLSA